MGILILIAVVLILTFMLIHKNKKMRKHEQLISELTMWHIIALTDDLTKIPNRAAYSNRIQELKSQVSAANNGSYIVLFDIDNFKQINDTHGHLAGDKVLQDCAAMLCNVFARDNCDVYRIGGDEFAVIAQNVSENYIIDMLLEVRKRENSGIGFRLSKGYDMFDGSRDISIVFKNADDMLYADKSSRLLNNE
ncbi:MAG: diguanylate cyclase [Clostridia bacterium]|nr:diguanylate cyclase [Clostridia bacterium]